ncbi:MAG TPA: hypothetical protein VFS21_35780, partial [Roseiflexaceae bacterium]|nr:hypothetical protein [Roseiflexaceae bacterium]
LSALIGGLVSAYSAYASYRAATAQAATTQAPAPDKSAAAAQGEQAAPLVKAAVAQHGEAREQTTLSLFEEDPTTYQEALARVLTQLAERNPAFAQQIQALAVPAPTGGIQSTQVIGGQAQVGTAVGVNTGTVSTTNTFGTGERQSDG